MTETTQQAGPWDSPAPTPSQHLPGNPYVDQLRSDGGPVTEDTVAQLAAAYEVRSQTLALLAAAGAETADGPAVDHVELQHRLGHPRPDIDPRTSMLPALQLARAAADALYTMSAELSEEAGNGGSRRPANYDHIASKLSAKGTEIMMAAARAATE